MVVGDTTYIDYYTHPADNIDGIAWVIWWWMIMRRDAPEINPWCF